MDVRDIVGQILGGVVQWAFMALFMAMSAAVTWILGA